MLVPPPCRPAPVARCRVTSRCAVTDNGQTIEHVSVGDIRVCELDDTFAHHQSAGRESCFHPLRKFRTQWN